MVSLAAVIIVVAISLVSFHDTLGFYFVEADTLTLIEGGRIESFSDVTRILTSDLMSALDHSADLTRGGEFMGFYRPVSSLTFSLDYAIWGLEPFGYYLSDLIYHILASVAVFFLARNLTRSQAIALIATTVFCIHPVMYDVVPSPTRRFETVATLFIVLSFILFIRYLDSQERHRGYLASSLAAYVLALGAKETAIILPFLLLVYFWIYHRHGSFREDALAAVRLLAPFIAITAALLAWRIHVLEGLGGYPRVYEPDRLFMMLKITGRYFSDLMYPIGFDRFFIFSPARSLAAAGVLLILMLLAISFFIGLRLRFRRGGNQWQAPPRSHRELLLASALGAASVAIISIILVLLLNSAGLGDMVRTVMLSHKTQALLAVMLIVIAIRERSVMLSFLARNELTRLSAFLIVWLLLPLGLILYSQVFFSRYMYLSLVPFSIFLATFTCIYFQKSMTLYWEYRGDRRANTLRRVRLCLLSGCIAVAVLTLSFIPVSPLFNNDHVWSDESRFTETFYSQLSEAVRQIPNGSTIYVTNIPRLVRTDYGTIRQVEETYQRGYSMNSWRRLYHPDITSHIISYNSKKYLDTFPKDFRLEVSGVGSGVYLVTLVYDGAREMGEGTAPDINPWDK